MSRLIDADALERDGWQMSRTVRPVDKDTMEFQTRKPTDFPAIEPQRKRGKWIAGPGNTHTCSECGFSMITNNDYIKRHYFCLNCGADMRGGQDD